MKSLNKKTLSMVADLVEFVESLNNEQKQDVIGFIQTPGCPGTEKQKQATIFYIESTM